MIEDSTIALNSIHAGDMPTTWLDLRDELISIKYALLRMEHSQHNAAHICWLGLLLYLVTILDNLLLGASLCDVFFQTARPT